MATNFMNEKQRQQSPHEEPCVLAIGFFDGVHLGHQHVIRTAVEKAQQLGVKSAVMTFSPHPKEVISKGKETVDMLTTLPEKERLIYELGVDDVYVIEFDEAFAAVTPEQFVANYLLPLQVKHVVVGFDFTYGKFGKGNVFTLKEQGKGHFSVTVIDKVTDFKEKISSTLIREKIKTGQIVAANNYLNRPYTSFGWLKPSPNGLAIGHFQTLLPKSGYYEVMINDGRRSYYTFVYCNKEENIVSIEEYQVVSYTDYYFNPNWDSLDKLTIHWLTKLGENTLYDEQDMVAQL